MTMQHGSFDKCRWPVEMCNRCRRHLLTLADEPRIDYVMGIIYVCMACGQYSAEREGLRDVSCFMHAQEFDTDKVFIKYNDDHTRVIGINVIGGPGE